jgi:hypothetical protein
VLPEPAVVSVDEPPLVTVGPGVVSVEDDGAVVGVVVSVVDDVPPSVVSDDDVELPATVTVGSTVVSVVVSVVSLVSVVSAVESEEDELVGGGGGAVVADAVGAAAARALGRTTVVDRWFVDCCSDSPATSRAAVVVGRWSEPVPAPADAAAAPVGPAAGPAGSAIVVDAATRSLAPSPSSPRSTTQPMTPTEMAATATNPLVSH